MQSRHIDPSITSFIQQLASSDVNERRSGAKNLEKLTMKSADNGISVREAQGIEPLVRLLRDPNTEVRQYASSTLLNMVVNSENQMLVAQSGGVAGSFHLLNDGNSTIKIKAARILQKCSINQDNLKYYDHQRGISDLVCLLSDPNSSEIKCAAAWALWDISRLDGYKIKIFNANAVTPLVNLLTDKEVDVKAAGALWELASHVPIAEAIHQAGAIQLLVQALYDSSWANRNSSTFLGALATLLSSCQHTSQKILFQKEFLSRSLCFFEKEVLPDNEMKQLIRLLAHLSSNDQVCAYLVEIDIIRLILPLLRNKEAHNRKNAVKLLQSLMKKSESVEKFRQFGGFILLIDLIDDDTEVVKKAAKALLNSLTKNNTVNQELVSTIIEFNDANDDSLWSIQSLDERSNHGEDLDDNIGELIVLILSKNSTSRQKAVQILFDMTKISKKRNQMIQLGMKELLDQFLNDPDLLVRNKISEILTELRSPAELIESSIRSLEDSTSKVRADAAKRLWDFMREDPINRSVVGQTRALDLLIHLLDDLDTNVRKNAAGALWEMGVADTNKVLLVEKGAIRPLKDLLKDGNANVRGNAAGAILNIAVNDDNKILLAKEGVFRPLIDLLKDETVLVRKNAVGAILRIAVNVDNAALLASEGVIQPLVDLLTDTDDKVRENASGALFRIAFNDNNGVLFADKKIIQVFIDLLKDNELGVRNNAVRVMSKIGKSRDNAVLLAKEGAIPLLCDLLKDTHEPTQKNSAMALESLAAHSLLFNEVGGVDILTHLVNSDSDQKIKNFAQKVLNVYYQAREEIERQQKKDHLSLIIQKLRSGDVKSFKLLVAQIKEVNLVMDDDVERPTLLHEAVRCGQLGIVAWLLDKKASLTAVNTEGKTSADIARSTNQPLMQVLFDDLSFDAGVALNTVNHLIDAVTDHVPAHLHLIRAKIYQKMGSESASSIKKKAYFSHGLRDAEAAVHLEITDDALSVQESLQCQLEALKNPVIEPIGDTQPLSDGDMPSPLPSTPIGVLPLIQSSALQVDYSKKLGEGSFGVVYRGVWQLITVAVKQLVAKRLSQATLKSFQEEAARHAALRHPNIVLLYGICLEVNHYSMVMECMARGSLFDLLHSQDEIPWTLRRGIAQHIATGLYYLHQHKIIHRDLKSLNVLITEDFTAKLSDFGLSSVKTETQSTTTLSHQAVGTVRWMAPELFKRGGKHTVLSDIYALGQVLWELSSRKIPFQDDANAINETIKDWVKDGERDEIPPETPTRYAALIAECWAQRTEDRPRSAEIVACTLMDEGIISADSSDVGLSSGYAYKSF